MTSTRMLTAALLLLGAAGGCLAQAVAPAAAASAPGLAASAPTRAQAAGGSLKHTVIEDRSVRIEETRLRGQAQRITVQSKLGGRPYEIVVGPGGRDPSQDHGATGQSTWSLFSY